jgi:hypothetical protein
MGQAPSLNTIDSDQPVPLNAPGNRAVSEHASVRSNDIAEAREEKDREVRRRCRTPPKPFC